MGEDEESKSETGKEAVTEKGRRMSDLISRQDAIDAVEFGITYAKAINKETGEVIALFEKSNAELKAAANRIKSLPSAEPKKGRWENVGMYTVECSECKAQLHELEHANYCPNCGADMREPKLQYGDTDTLQGGLMSAT